MWVYGLDWSDPGQRQVADACECGNEPWGSVKCGEFLDQLQTSQLLKDSAPWSKYRVFLNVAMIFYYETIRSHTGVDEDYALLTGEVLLTFQWTIVLSSLTVGPEDEGN